MIILKSEKNVREPSDDLKWWKFNCMQFMKGINNIFLIPGRVYSVVSHWTWNRSWLIKMTYSDFACQLSRPSSLGCVSSGGSPHLLAQAEHVHRKWQANWHDWFRTICCSGRLHSTLRILHIQWRISGKADTNCNPRGWRDHTLMRGAVCTIERH